MEDPNTYELDKDIKLSTDPRNSDLSFSIAIWILARIVNFFEFNDFSLYLIIFITINLSLGLLFVFVIALGSKKLKNTLICIFIMSGINVVGPIIALTSPQIIHYEMDPFNPIIMIIIMLIVIVFIRRIFKVYFSPLNQANKIFLFHSNE